MAQLLGNIAVGQTVYLKENGTPQPYLVVHQGLPSSLYDASCNGTWLLRRDIYNNAQWNSTNNNTFTSATVNTTYLPGLLSMYDTAIQSVIKTVKIPYCVGGGNSAVNSGANGYSCKLFLLSGYEVGWTRSDSSYFPVDGAKLSYFTSGTSSAANNKRIANYNGSAVRWWLRSPSTSNSNNAWLIYSGGNSGNDYCTNSYGIRPAMIMPTNLLVLDDGSILTIGTPTITAPSNAMQGQPIPISWTAVDGANTYQLQRNTGSSWETIYTGANLSYEDTAGSWTTVQYQVAAGIGTDYGEYAQTASIPVISASALVISGTDGDLGTLTNDIPYTVTSDTGNDITLTCTVNGVQYAQATVSSGFAYNIPIMELPTGTNEIVIAASVQVTGGPVSVTRTWTYTKTPATFPPAGSTGTVQQSGNTIFPKTLAEAVRVNPAFGGSLDKALDILGLAALYKTAAPTQQIGTLTEGTIIYLNENGSPVPFYVAKQNYEPDYNTNRTLVVRKDAVTQGAWNSSNVNTYNGSTIDSWFNSTYLNTLDSDVQTAIGMTNIPYTPMGGTTSVQRINKGVFALSGAELGLTITTGFNTEGTAVPISSMLQIAYNNGTAIIHWTRSPQTNTTTNAFEVVQNGEINPFSSNYASAYYRPAFTLPSTFTAYLDEPTTGFFDIQNNLLMALPGSGTGFAQIETGSYTGTGTYGANNPNTLTFGFEPIFFVVMKRSSSNSQMPNQSSYAQHVSGQFYAIRNAQLLGCTAQNPGNSGSTAPFIQLEWMDSSTKWWVPNSNNAADQFNESGTTYDYIALG